MANDFTTRKLKFWRFWVAARRHRCVVLAPSQHARAPNGDTTGVLKGKIPSEEPALLGYSNLCSNLLGSFQEPKLIQQLMQWRVLEAVGAPTNGVSCRDSPALGGRDGAHFDSISCDCTILWWLRRLLIQRRMVVEIDNSLVDECWWQWLINDNVEIDDND